MVVMKNNSVGTSKVLKQRIITAVLLLLSLIAVTTMLSSFYFAILISLLLLLATWEWAGFIGLSQRSSKQAYVLTIAVMLFGLFFLLGIFPAAEKIDNFRVAVILGLGLLYWLLSLFLLSAYPKNRQQWNDESKIACMGVFSLIPAWTGLVSLKYFLPSGYLVLALVVLVAAVDVGAYFAGVNFGSRKLAPNLSPKKSWEGVWGGLLVCLLVSGVLSWSLHTYWFKLSTLQVLLLLALSLVLTFLTVVGDLVESMLKRNRGIKDSGILLPGHGGLLDRIDGLIAATPAFALVMMMVLN